MWFVEQDSGAGLPAVCISLSLIAVIVVIHLPKSGLIPDDFHYCPYHLLRSMPASYITSPKPSCVELIK
jgi:hypothetical protein